MEQEDPKSSDSNLKVNLPEPATSVASTVSIVLDSQPSCCEFAKYKDLLVVGTYNLIEGREGKDQPLVNNVETPPQERTGSVLVFHITEQTAKLLQTKLLSHAVLDLHFSPSDPSIIAVATSVGTVCFFSIDFDNDGFLTPVKTIRVYEPSIMVLSLAYQSSNGSPQIAVSGSDGSIAVFPDTQKKDEVIDSIPAHSFEAWTVALSRHLPRKLAGRSSNASSVALLYSGGDDSALIRHELGTTVSQKNDSRSHYAGVTAIVILPVIDEDKDEEILATGSYDESIRIMTAPGGVLAEKSLGGGIFRISRPFVEDVAQDGGDLRYVVLASCMHAGAKVVQIQRTAGKWSIETIAQFTEHESMNYAGDARASGEGHLFVSTSFYDRKLCVWTLLH